MAKRLVRTVILGLVGVVALAVVGPNVLAWWLSRGQVHSSVAATPSSDVTIVFGAGLDQNGRPGRYLTARLNLAADLYEAGKTRVLLLSGATASNYDEPKAMRRYLVETRGIPSERIVLDEHGDDTYSTCVRAKKVFGVDHAIVVTQSYHLTRTVATCQQAGIEVQGLGDTSVGTASGTWRFGVVREWGATMKMARDFTMGRDPVLGAHDPAVEEALAKK
ncbi:SanA/YdcF family protein [Propionibacteriaceae bacterium G1746]